MLYEDLQYLSVSAVALAGIAGLLMLTMWLLDKVYRRIVAWRQKKQMQGKAERHPAGRPREPVSSFCKSTSPSFNRKRRHGAATTLMN